LDPTRNRDFYRELADYFRNSAHLCEITVVVNNSSTTVAEGTIVTLTAKAGSVSMLSSDDFPEKPSTNRIRIARPGRVPQPQRVEVAQFGDYYELRAIVGNVRPGTTEWAAEPFFVGARESVVVSVNVEISANNLRIPVRCVGELDIQAKAVEVTVADLMAFAAELDDS
jgi:hypothetical protein